MVPEEDKVVVREEAVLVVEEEVLLVVAEAQEQDVGPKGEEAD
jgi:hypothetical protein